MSRRHCEGALTGGEGAPAARSGGRAWRLVAAAPRQAGGSRAGGSERTWNCCHGRDAAGAGQGGRSCQRKGGPSPRDGRPGVSGQAAAGTRGTVADRSRAPPSAGPRRLAQIVQPAPVVAAAAGMPRCRGRARRRAGTPRLVSPVSQRRAFRRRCWGRRGHFFAMTACAGAGRPAPNSFRRGRAPPAPRAPVGRRPPAASA